MPFRDKEKQIEWSKKYNLKNKDKKIEYARKYYKENREKVLEFMKKYNISHKKEKREYEKKRYIKEAEKQKNYSRNYRKEHPEWEKNNQLKNKYGITLDSYNELLVKQNGVCAICLNREKSKNKFGKVRNLYVDHNHETGKVRGLLCHNCNSMLGYSGDNPTILEIGKEYLIKHL